jgi:nicotinamidase-related amidase
MMLKFPEPRPVKVKVEETLLQIVDMQYDFCNPNGAFYVPMTENILPNIKKLLDRARELDMVVVHQDSHGYPTPGEIRWKRLRGSFNGWYGPVVDELKPVNRPKEYVVPKTTHDIFFHTWMDELLENLPEIDTAIVVGVKTNVCVLYTVAGYCIRGYRVIVPMDCVAAMNDEIQAMALNVIANFCPAFPATITTSEMITFV